jgi:hypothetical protein
MAESESRVQIGGRPRSMSAPVPVGHQERPAAKEEAKTQQVAAHALTSQPPHQDQILPLGVHIAEKESQTAFLKDAQTQQLKDAEVKFTADPRKWDPPPTTERGRAYEELALYQAELEVNEAAKAAGHAPVFSARDSIEMNGKKVLFLSDKVIITGISPFETGMFIKELQTKATDEKGIYYKYKSLINRLDPSTALSLDFDSVDDAKKTGRQIGAEYLTALCGHSVTHKAVTASSVQAAVISAKDKHSLPSLKPWKTDIRDITAQTRESFRHRIRWHVREEEYRNAGLHAPPAKRPPPPPPPHAVPKPKPMKEEEEEAKGGGEPETKPKGMDDVD